MNLAKQALTVGVWAAAVITRFAYQASKRIILSWPIFSNTISLEKTRNQPLTYIDITGEIHFEEANSDENAAASDSCGGARRIRGRPGVLLPSTFRRKKHRPIHLCSLNRRR